MDGGWRNGADHHIARDAARVPRSESENQHPKEIEPVLDTSHGTAEREDKSAPQIEHRQRCAHEILFGDHRSAHLRDTRPIVSPAAHGRVASLADRSSDSMYAGRRSRTGSAEVGDATA